jgi:hypothetical protein
MKPEGRGPVKWRGRGSRRAELIAAYGVPALALRTMLGYLRFRGLKTP